MIRQTKLNATIETANAPRWRKPLTESSTGKKKAGFWYILLPTGSRKSLTAYGAPLTCRGKNGTKEERNQALEARNRYIEEVEEEQAPKPKKVLTVFDVFKPYLEKCESDRNKKIIKTFCEGRKKEEFGCLPFRGFGLLPYDQLSTAHFDTWEEAHPNWGHGGKRNGYLALKAGLNFAKKPEGGRIIEKQPLEGMKFSKSDSEAVWFKEDKVEEKLVREHLSRSMKVWFDAMLDLGTRPMELGRVTTDHVKKTPKGLYVWVLQAHEWKNGKKTGKKRVIAAGANPRWQEYTEKKLAEAKKKGKPVFLFTNNYGKPLQGGSINSGFRYAKQKIKKKDIELTPGLCPYSCRHTAITRMLKKPNLSESVIATACGTSPGVIRRTYSHLLDDTCALAEAIGSLADSEIVDPETL